MTSVRAVQVVPSLAPEGGGPSYTVPRLCQELSSNGVEVRLLTVGKPERSHFEAAEFHEHYLSRTPLLRQLRASRHLKRVLSDVDRNVAALHAHGLWLMPNVYAGEAAKAAAIPLVVSPRGMLSQEALSFSPNRKRVFWKLLQRAAYDGASVYHATSEDEAESIRDFGITAPIVVIPNGVDVPTEVAAHRAEQESRTLLFLSRLHPKKGLPLLIEAWKALEKEFPSWSLVIAGPDEGGHRDELEKRALSCERISFFGAVYGTDKQRLIGGSDLFILPTMNENFGVVVAEALAAGVPAIVTKGAPWSGLKTYGCGWWIERDLHSLQEALREAMSLPAAARQSMGLLGREWVQSEFSWQKIARDFEKLYRDLS